jgi:hypothetical protein
MRERREREERRGERERERESASWVCLPVAGYTYKEVSGK